MTFETLSEESLKHVEAGAAAHRLVVELAEQRGQKLAETEHELKLAHLELDHLRLATQDLTERVRIAEEAADRAVEARVAYETLFLLIGTQIAKFLPPVPPVDIHTKLAPTALQTLADASNGGGREGSPRGFAPARYQLPGVER